MSEEELKLREDLAKYIITEINNMTLKAIKYISCAIVLSVVFITTIYFLVGNL